MTMPKFIPQSEKQARKGRKPQYDSGVQAVLTIRLPKEVRDELVLFYRNHPEFNSISHVAATALAKFLLDNR